MILFQLTTLLIMGKRGIFYFLIRKMEW